jgi:hypothetical protein
MKNLSHLALLIPNGSSLISDCLLLKEITTNTKIMIIGDRPNIKLEKLIFLNGSSNLTKSEFSDLLSQCPSLKQLTIPKELA